MRSASMQSNGFELVKAASEAVLIPGLLIMIGCICGYAPGAIDKYMLRVEEVYFTFKVFFVFAVPGILMLIPIMYAIYVANRQMVTYVNDVYRTGDPSKVINVDMDENEDNDRNKKYREVTIK